MNALSVIDKHTRSTHIHAHARTHTHTHHAHTHTRTHTRSTHIHTHAHAHTRTHTHTQYEDNLNIKHMSEIDFFLLIDGSNIISRNYLNMCVYMQA